MSNDSRKMLYLLVSCQAYYKMPTCPQFAVLPGRTVGDDALDLQELVLGIVAPHDREAQAAGRLQQAGADVVSLEYTTNI